MAYPKVIQYTLTIQMIINKQQFVNFSLSCHCKAIMIGSVKALLMQTLIRIQTCKLYTLNFV